MVKKLSKTTLLLIAVLIFLVLGVSVYAVFFLGGGQEIVRGNGMMVTFPEGKGENEIRKAIGKFGLKTDVEDSDFWRKYGTVHGWIDFDDEDKLMAEQLVEELKRDNNVVGVEMIRSFKSDPQGDESFWRVLVFFPEIVDELAAGVVLNGYGSMEKYLGKIRSIEVFPGEGIRGKVYGWVMPAGTEEMWCGLLMLTKTVKDCSLLVLD